MAFQPPRGFGIRDIREDTPPPRISRSRLPFQPGYGMSGSSHVEPGTQSDPMQTFLSTAGRVTAGMAAERRASEEGSFLQPQAQGGFDSFDSRPLAPGGNPSRFPMDYRGTTPEPFPLPTQGLRPPVDQFGRLDPRGRWQEPESQPPVAHPASYWGSQEASRGPETFYTYPPPPRRVESPSDVALIGRHRDGQQGDHQQPMVSPDDTNPTRDVMHVDVTQVYRDSLRAESSRKRKRAPDSERQGEQVPADERMQRVSAQYVLASSLANAGEVRRSLERPGAMRRDPATIAAIRDAMRRDPEIEGLTNQFINRARGWVTQDLMRITEDQRDEIYIQLARLYRAGTIDENVRNWAAEYAKLAARPQGFMI